MSIIKREKVRDGVLVAEQITVDMTGSDVRAQFEALRQLACFQTGAELLQGYRAKAKAIVESGGKGNRMKYAATAVEYFDDASRALSEVGDPASREKADWAIRNLLFAMQSLWRAEVKKFERELVSGAKSTRGAKNANDIRAGEAATQRREWQRQADAHWRKNARLSASDVAKLIDDQRWDYIRRFIKKKLSKPGAETG